MIAVFAVDYVLAECGCSLLVDGWTVSACVPRLLSLQSNTPYAGLCREEGEVSPRLAPAVTAAAEGLARLAANLDAVAFREVWRAVAVALNRTLYNDVATEAAFSPQVNVLSAGKRVRVEMIAE